MSSKPLRLDRMFRHARVVPVVLRNGDYIGPPVGFAWMILSGLVDHKTGTDCYVSVSQRIAGVVQNGFFGSRILSATTTATYPLFNTSAAETQTQWVPTILVEKDELHFTGDAAALCIIRVLEWELE